MEPDICEVKAVRTIKAPADRVWEIVGAFSDLDKWHPAIVKSDYDPVRKTRTLTAQDGTLFVEELLSESDRDYSYRILSGPLPVARYQATLHVAPLGQDLSEIGWTGQFQPEGVTEAEAREIVGGIYKAGLDNVEKLVTESA